jgi:hypothetical protein
MTKLVAIHKPFRVDAVQLNWKNWNDVADFLGDILGPLNPAFEIRADEASDTCREHGPVFLGVSIPTLEGKVRVVHGDYIVKGSQDEIYSVRPEIFEKTYEVIAEY